MRFVKGRRTISIYLIFDVNGAPCYVGKSDFPERRFKQHQRHQWAASYVVIEVVDPADNWRERERFWIAYYRQWFALKNVSKGGVGAESYGVFYRNRDEIIDLLRGTNLSFTDIGQRFGVSRELIRQIAQGLKLKSGYERQAAAKQERLNQSALKNPLTSSFIAQCEARNLRWRFLPDATQVLSRVWLIVEDLTVRVKLATWIRIPTSPTREYVRIVSCRGKSRIPDIVAYHLPNGKWLLLPRSHQARVTTAFCPLPPEKSGSKQDRHDWREFVDVWGIFKHPAQERDC